MKGDPPIVRCIYCCEHKPASKEHYLPECLGKFEDFDSLADRICRDCNGDIGRELEDQFCRGGDIGLMRQRLGIRGKKSHKTKVNPFERGSSGASRLEMKGRIPGQERKVRLQIIKGTKTIEYLPQIILITESGEEHHITIPDDMTDPAELLRRVKELPIERRLKQVSLVAPKSESKRFEKLASVLPVQPGATWEDLPLTGSAYTLTKFEVTSKFFRAIAKIGFHYLLKHLPFRGDEDIFIGIRRFIMEGGDISQFVTWSENQILQPVRDGLVPPTYCHIITAIGNTKLLWCKLQFFLGPDSVPRVYTVRIEGNDTSLLYSVDSGHLFGYYSDGPKNGNDGFVIELYPQREFAGEDLQCLTSDRQIE